MRNALLELSSHGMICYLETEYFGGEGGQGALVVEGGQQIVPPTWAAHGTINDALELIGIERIDPLDEFDTIDLGGVRKNDDLLNREDRRITKR